MAERAAVVKRQRKVSDQKSQRFTFITARPMRNT